MQAKNFEFKTKNMFVQITSKSNFLAILLSIDPEDALDSSYDQNLQFSVFFFDICSSQKMSHEVDSFGIVAHGKLQ